MKYRRITLKLSGEAFSKPESGLVDAIAVQYLVAQLVDVVQAGTEVSIVPGGGNVFRGRDLQSDAQKIGLRTTTADQIGMLATVMNALVLRDALQQVQIDSVIYTPHAINGVSEGFSSERASKSMAAGAIVISAGGTGNPLFTTDTAASLRAVELGSDVVVKATQVDGVYDSDPNTTSNAQRFDRLSFDEVIQRNLKVMDLSAFVLCREHDVPIIVYSLHARNALTKIVKGENVGTLIYKRDGSD